LSRRREAPGPFRDGKQDGRRMLLQGSLDVWASTCKRDLALRRKIHGPLSP